MGRKPNDAQYIRILRLLAEGLYPKKIAKCLKLKPSNLHFYIQKLLTEKKIEPETRSNIQTYKLTSYGIATLFKSERCFINGFHEPESSSNSDSISGGAETRISSNQNAVPTLVETVPPALPDPPRFDNLHSIQFKALIHKEGTIWFPNEAQLKGWCKGYDWFNDVLVEKTSKHLIFRFRLKARDEWQALANGYRIVTRLMEQIEQAYGTLLGHPILISKPHYTVTGDPVANAVGDSMRVTVPDIGHIDKSDEKELEYRTPELVGQYIKMPITVNEMRSHQLRQQEQLNALVDAVDVLAQELIAFKNDTHRVLLTLIDNQEKFIEVNKKLTDAILGKCSGQDEKKEEKPAVITKPPPEFYR